MALNVTCRDAAAKCVARLDCLASNRELPDAVASEATTVVLAYLDIIGWETELVADDRREAVARLAEAHWTSSTSYALGLRPAGAKQTHLAPPALPAEFSQQLTRVVESARLASDFADSTMPLPAAAPPVQSMRALRHLLQRCKRRGEVPGDDLLVAVISTGAQCDGETSRVIKAWVQLCRRPNLTGRDAMVALARQVRTSIALFAVEAGETFAALPLGHRLTLLTNVVVGWEYACAYALPDESATWATVHESLSRLARQPLYASGGVPSPLWCFPKAPAADAPEVSFARKYLHHLGEDTPKASMLGMQPQLVQLCDFVRQAFETRRYAKTKRQACSAGPDAQGHIIVSGASGTGKTYAVRAIAKELGAPFFRVKASDLVVKWQGESARNIQRFFLGVDAYACARNTLAIVGIDEIETLLARRDPEAPSATERDDITNEILQITDTTAPLRHTLIIGTTNRPMSIDTAFARRFAWFDVPAASHAVKSAWLQATIADALDGTVKLSSHQMARLCDLGQALPTAQVRRLCRAALPPANDTRCDGVELYRRLRRALMDARVQQSDATIYAAPHGAPQGFSVRFEIDAPSATSDDVYLRHAATTWRLRWVAESTGDLYNLALERVSGAQPLYAARLAFDTPGDGAVARWHQSRQAVRPGAVLEWSFQGTPWQPGTRRFAEALMHAPTIGCVAEFRYSPEASLAYLAAVGGSAPVIIGSGFNVAWGSGLSSLASSVATAPANFLLWGVAEPLAAAGLPGSALVNQLAASSWAATYLASGGMPLAAAVLPVAAGAATTYGVGRLCRWWRAC